ncbi:MAG: hypothetical protein NTV97_17650 [Alphaproteobacteria bacterium]|nr:hypothetical protein [Alphaproteobacteria bacterium]
MQDTPKKPSKDGVEGEGSYSATQAYNESTARFIAQGKVDKAAREARRAMESNESGELKAAEAVGKAGAIHGKAKPEPK